MTAQAPDSVSYDGTDYVIAGINGGPLFDPGDHGLHTVMTSTANWRGYVAHYVVRDGRFLLSRLTDVGLPPDADGATPVPPDLNGAPASGGDHSYEYADVDLPVAFSGGLLLGADFRTDLYTHMGFHPAWKFERVLELILERGTLQRAADRSAEIAVVRQEIVAGGREDPDGGRDVTRWIARTFELDYGRTFS